MGKTMLINASQMEESRIAVIENGTLELFEIESVGERQLKGNIYKGRIVNMSHSIQAAFVDIGLEKPAFLPLDEVNFRNKPPFQAEIPRKPRRLRISDIFKKGQEVVVQVSRESFGDKPPTLSTFYSLAGRYVVLMPYVEAEAISRRIAGNQERERLKKMIEELGAPEGFGLIVRTAGVDQNKSLLQSDLKYLMMLWRHIDKEARESAAPSLIFKERDVVIRTLRDYFTPDIAEVIVDNEAVFHDIQHFFRVAMPGKERRLQFYNGEMPIFMKFNIEDQIESIFQRKVELKSGAYIFIDSTEALTAIDVNSGKSKSQKSIEETALKTNLEAAEEIARQLRLRDIGGLIVIDFIDMKSPKYSRDVERVLRNALRKDRARFDITRMSKFGIVELSRQRLKPVKTSSRYMACATCGGGGTIKTVESSAIAVLHRLHAYFTQNHPENIVINLPEDVALYLLNNKKKELMSVEKQAKTKITIKIKPAMKPDEYQFEVA